MSRIHGMTMNPNEWRLLIEAVLVTATISFAGFLALYSFVLSKRNSNGMIAELLATNEDMTRRLRALERGREQDHETMLWLRSNLGLQNAYSRALADYARMLADRLRALGEKDIPPAPTPPPELEPPRPFRMNNNDRALHTVIAALFSNEEMDDLAYRAGIEPESLEGRTRTRRAQSLVETAGRQGVTDELIALARQLRPEGGI